ncbi:class I SAM-dependent DNA methyltransferase, partial [Apilactobacillus sp. F1]|nr:class I SAM-dependent DNA methyltransferase [Apilactobacillus sp. F1]
FAHTSFKWTNNAKRNAGIIVVIVGVENNIDSLSQKYIYTNNQKKIVNNISPYLTSGENIIIHKKSKRNDDIPQMKFGSMANDGGNMILSEDEYKNVPEDSKRFFKKLIGSKEFINSENRYCLWLYDVY